MLTATVLAGCGSDSGPPELAWYIDPDDGGQVEIARRCTAEAPRSMHLFDPATGDNLSARQQAPA